ncbi:unnamed protein product [Ranitomeya imitator]|uniref:Uncharacterized protein n=1 Tax=Ranitomeya imitator TaxID=111125 RepID=A0ABN9LA83_9NEOB|nr:unnamed protein product [Ranitomeya imitator]
MSSGKLQCTQILCRDSLEHEDSPVVTQCCVVSTMCHITNLYGGVWSWGCETIRDSGPDL